MLNGVEWLDMYFGKVELFLFFQLKHRLITGFNSLLNIFIAVGI